MKWITYFDVGIRIEVFEESFEAEQTALAWFDDTAAATVDRVVVPQLWFDARQYPFDEFEEGQDERSQGRRSQIVAQEATRAVRNDPAQFRFVPADNRKDLPTNQTHCNHRKCNAIVANSFDLFS